MVKLIEQVAYGSKIIIITLAVNAVVNCNKMNIIFGKHNLCVISDFQIITPEARHILNNNRTYFARFNIGNHLLKSLAVKGRAAYSVVNVKLAISKAVIVSEPLQYLLLRTDLSRGFSAKVH